MKLHTRWLWLRVEIKASSRLRSASRMLDDRGCSAGHIRNSSPPQRSAAGTGLRSCGASGSAIASRRHRSAFREIPGLHGSPGLEAERYRHAFKDPKAAMLLKLDKTEGDQKKGCFTHGAGTTALRLPQLFDTQLSRLREWAGSKSVVHVFEDIQLRRRRARFPHLRGHARNISNIHTNIQIHWKLNNFLLEGRCEHNLPLA